MNKAIFWLGREKQLLNGPTRNFAGKYKVQNIECLVKLRVKTILLFSSNFFCASGGTSKLRSLLSETSMAVNVGNVSALKLSTIDLTLE